MASAAWPTPEEREKEKRKTHEFEKPCHFLENEGTCSGTRGQHLLDTHVEHPSSSVYSKLKGFSHPFLGLQTSDCKLGVVGSGLLSE